MNKQDVLEILAKDFSTNDLSFVVRALKYKYFYNFLRVSVPKGRLLNSLTGAVTMKHLIQVLGDFFAYWDEDCTEDESVESGRAS